MPVFLFLSAAQADLAPAGGADRPSRRHPFRAGRGRVPGVAALAGLWPRRGRPAGDRLSLASRGRSADQQRPAPRMAAATTPSHCAVPDRVDERVDHRDGGGDLGGPHDPAPASGVWAAGSRPPDDRVHQMAGKWSVSRADAALVATLTRRLAAISTKHRPAGRQIDTKAPARSRRNPQHPP